MSHQYTAVKNYNSPITITPTSRLTTLGSCFSENIGKKLAYHKWSTTINPIGIIYNPVSLARSIKTLTNKTPLLPDSCKTNGEIHFHYDYHSQLSALSKEELCTNITNAISCGHQAMKQSDWLLITLGTSIVHELKATKTIVANNHRMPANIFNKRMLTIDESVENLVKALHSHSTKNIILTVSPIRHTRDGLVQNNRSKSRLIEVAHKLNEALPNASYFPAYEILMDGLRDYRYYQKDMIHPTAEAIDIVWHKFVNTYMDNDSKQKVLDISNYLRSANHKPQFPRSKSNESFLNNLEKKRIELQDKYPEIGVL